MPDTQPIIPPEAIRAVAEQIASDDGGNYDSGSDYDRQGYDDAAEAYIAAAIPFLPQHVSPSAEGVMALDTWQLEGGPTRDERIAWVLAALAEVYTPTGVLLWLQARNRTLGGRPIDMLTGANAEDFDRVGQVVSAMVETSAS